MKTKIHYFASLASCLLLLVAMNGCKKDDVATAPTCLFESYVVTGTNESQKAAYDSQRRLVKITVKGLAQDGKTIITDEIAFTCNADGKIGTSVTTRNGVEIRKRLWLYTNGTFSGADIYANGAKTPTYGRRYTLNAAGNVIFTKGTKTTDDPNGDQFTIEWLYDTNQNLIKATYKDGADVVVLDEISSYDTNPLASYSAKDYPLSPYDGSSPSVNNSRKEKLSLLDDQTGKLVLGLDLVNAYTYDANGYATALAQTENVSNTKSNFTFTYFGCN